MNKQVRFTTLKRINVPKGDVYRALKSSENDYSSFGEAYFTTINPSQIKGWKKHNRMDMNLLVPQGDVNFHIYNEDMTVYQKFRINSHNYGRLFVPSGYWMAFEGVGSEFNLILNIASIEHDPSEGEVISLDELILEPYNEK